MTAGQSVSSKSGGYEGFKILPVKFTAESRCPHHLFFKPHSVKASEPTKPPERTLFCANVPPWMTAEALRRLFQNNGPIGMEGESLREKSSFSIVNQKSALPEPVHSRFLPAPFPGKCINVGG